MRSAMLSTIAVAAVLAMTGPARADTACGSYFAAGWWFCEDFDTYCTNPLPDGDGQCPRGADYGEPDPVRAAGALSSKTGAWPRTSLNYHLALDPDGHVQICGSTLSHEDIDMYLASSPYGGRNVNGGDEHGELGQATRDLSSYITTKWPGNNRFFAGKGPDPNDKDLQLRASASGGIKLASKLWTSNGYLELALEETEEKKADYLDREVTPTDFIMVGSVETVDPTTGDECISCYNMCPGPFYSTHSAWPSICQSYEARRPGSICPQPEDPTAQCPPPYCPEVPADKIHKNLAIGCLARLDPNPCHCELIAGYQKPTGLQLAFFDGWKWRILGRGHAGPEGDTTIYEGGDFYLGAKVDSFDMTIYETTVDIHHYAKRWIDTNGDGTLEWQDVHSYAYNVPRKYLGGFNVLRSGTSSSCELVPSQDGTGSYNCVQWAGTKCQKQGGQRCDTGAYEPDGSGFVSIDNVAIEGGLPGVSIGACCLSTGVCIDGQSPSQCAAQPGARADSFRGNETTCADPGICMGACCHTLGSCAEGVSITECDAGSQFQGFGKPCPAECPCHYPRPDTDMDGDVDQSDFAVLQSCFTGTYAGAPAGLCKCLDMVPNNAVDNDDYLAFEACASGPGVPVDAACD